MDNTNINKKIMRKIVRYKKTRDWEWIVGFMLVSSIAGIIFMIWWWTGWIQLQEGGVMDPLQILTENFLVIKEYLFAILADLVWETPAELILAMLILLGLAVFVMITRKRRRLIARELKNIRKYEKSN